MDISKDMPLITEYINFMVVLNIDVNNKAFFEGKAGTFLIRHSRI